MNGRNLNYNKKICYFKIKIIIKNKFELIKKIKIKIYKY